MASGTFSCGDLFPQPGHGGQALTEADILAPGAAFRQPRDCRAHSPQTTATLLRLAGHRPRLACMHGSARRKGGGALLRQLVEACGARGGAGLAERWPTSVRSPRADCRR
jgi:hypothetical protein